MRQISERGIAPTIIVVLLAGQLLAAQLVGGDNLACTLPRLQQQQQANEGSTTHLQHNRTRRTVFVAPCLVTHSKVCAGHAIVHTFM